MTSRNREDVAGHGRGGPCSRCGGRTSRGADEDGATVDKCFACGHEAIVAPPEEDSYALTTVVRPWTDAALERLAAVLALLKSADLLRVEAERIHATLTAYGTTVPDLPWRNPLVKRSGDKRTRAYRCRNCGVRMSGAGVFKRDPPPFGPRVCRDEAACRARAAARA